MFHVKHYKNIQIESAFFMILSYFYKTGKDPVKQRNIKFLALQSNGVFDPRGDRQLCMQPYPLGSLLAGINLAVIL